MHETRLMKTWLDKVDEQTLTEVLGELMSAVSEDCYCAGWMEGTEYVVPELCRRVMKLHRPHPWAHGELGPGMAAVLMTIADKLGHWATLNEGSTGFVPFDPWPTPAKYVKDLDEWKAHWKNRKKK